LLQDFPTEYGYFKTTSFRFRGRTILGHDHLLASYPGADGIKTGYTDASGFNLVTSAVHSNTRLIGVILGAARAGERDIHMASLLDQGFDQMDVPAMVAQRESPGLGLISAAHAATLPARSQPRWSVQVGAFVTEGAARKAANTAQRLTGSGDVAVEKVAVRRKISWRAQLIGLSDAEARGACAALAKRKLTCALLRPNPGQVASR
jgi:D-alanyl-D-alanine carboxypeptidase